METYFCLTEKSRGSWIGTGVTPHSVVKRDFLFCGPIRCGLQGHFKAKIAAPTPAITSAFQRAARRKGEEKETLPLFKKTSSLLLASRWLGLSHIAREPEKSSLCVGQLSA